MTRKEFIQLVGVGSGTAFFIHCLQGCKKADNSPAASTVDFTLDLTQSSNAALKNNGGYIYNSGVIVARTSTGNYIAVAAACTHEGTNIQFDLSNNRFHCSNHGANFSTSGTVITGPASTALKQYTTTLNGNSLRVNG